ncbi:MAG: TetR/AcrR family transcriptional regulator [Mycolicibacterium hassiacum]|nr:TetR/AcrR family transcriptional regulator [Mycolicibacterium hassiacum]
MSSPSGRPGRHVCAPNTGGRPRLAERRRPGDTARDEVLDAAAELFTTLGFAATSTRQIAEAVGMRQASLYHHFRTKHDMLAALLDTTVASSLAAAHRLLDRPESPDVLLHALTYLDCRQLWDSPWNLGILYLLPEVRDPRFDEFHRRRNELRQSYRILVRRLLTDCDTAADHPVIDEDLVFRLVETLPNLRADGLGEPDQPRRTADLALHVLGWRGDWAALHTASAEVVEEVARAIADPPADPAP